jgi:hypothetical protein
VITSGQSLFLRQLIQKLKHLVDKTPAEAMTGKAHKPWLEMIGYTPFQRKEA